jgi:signal transduction histidine kinase
MVAVARWRPGTPARRDVLLAVATGVLLLVSVRVAYATGSARPTAWTYVGAAVIAVPLVRRRRYPLAVLLTCAVLLFGFYTLFPHAGMGVAIPLGVALYGAAEYGHLRWALAVSAFYTLAGGFALIVGGQQSPVQAVAALVQQGSLLAAICLLGEAVHSRRGWAAEIRNRLAHAARTAEIEREQEAQRRVEQERLRIARELHDVLAHTISALTIQARVIKDGLPGDGPPAVRAAADAILSTGRDAMGEVRAAIGVLRVTGNVAGQDGSTVPDVGHLDALVTPARAAGLTANVVTTGQPKPLPPAVNLTAYRIIQEALTNVVRHAAASTVTITLAYEPAQLTVEISDDGQGLANIENAGYGLIGMHERANAIGGEVTIGPRPEGGFLVSATLPLAHSTPW